MSRLQRLTFASLFLLHPKDFLSFLFALILVVPAFDNSGNLVNLDLRDMGNFPKALKISRSVWIKPKNGLEIMEHSVVLWLP
ncbi:hypothetical protein C8F04DRAFT_601748 [Mycena alexandri]|uniref:Uncharacterized protein n=1 Tax=Mycena alexandri TaxID=1745969 RepID=A0AAD6X3B1_9AGAR|nr:hypothetical protein C8F04DRAFT_601748 [Mycena alexandri]